jgi:hypothetical protein
MSRKSFSWYEFYSDFHLYSVVKLYVEVGGTLAWDGFEAGLVKYSSWSRQMQISHLQFPLRERAPDIDKSSADRSLQCFYWSEVTDKTKIFLTSLLIDVSWKNFSVTANCFLPSTVKGIMRRSICSRTFQPVRARCHLTSCVSNRSHNATSQRTFKWIRRFVYSKWRYYYCVGSSDCLPVSMATELYSEDEEKQQISKY